MIDLPEVRWVELDDWICWCEVDEKHIYFVAEIEKFLNDLGDLTVHENDLIVDNGRTLEICKVEVVDNTDPTQDWVMVYVHPREEVQPMTEEEWYGLYGNPELAD